MKTIQHKFVEFVPQEPDPGILYITVEYRTAVHLCVCGCGNKVVTPLSPTDWTLEFNGKSVSLSPSIGNWNFECKSHYWITRNQIHYSTSWDEKKVDAGRKQDKKNKEQFFSLIRKKLKKRK